MRILLYVIAMTCILAFAQLQPPSPCPFICGENQQETTDKPDKPANDQQRGTENAPVVVKVIPSDNAVEKEKYKTAREEQNTAIEHRNAIANMVMAGTTVIILLVTIGMSVHGRNTARKQLRAYVGISATRISDDKNTCVMSVTNSGQTPANNVTAYLNLRWDNFGTMLPEGFSYPDLGANGQVRSNTAIIPGQLTNLTFPVDTVKLEEAKAGMISLFIYGHIDYKDAFGKDRETTFCYHVVPWKGHGAVIAWHKHNECK